MQSAASLPSASDGACSRLVRYAIVTFGCRVNQADSLRIEEDLRARGGLEAAPAAADLVVVNTCSVTATADQGARQTIRRIARDNPSARIVVTGCYATREPADRRPSAERAPDRAQCGEGSPRRRGVRKRRPNDSGRAMVRVVRRSRREPAGRTAFTLRVQTGCEERCSYCIIPTTRGAGRSMPVAAVIDEVERIAAAGFKEIALTGVHLGSYGRDLTPPASLYELLNALRRVRSRRGVSRELAGADGLHARRCVADCREPWPLCAALPSAIAAREQQILALMRRPYTLDFYRRLVDSIIASLPHAAIGTDLIVGFPGETDEDFAENVQYLPSSPLSHLHVFPYSDRPGTEASSLPSRVPPSVIRDRGVRMREIGALLASRFREAQVGSLRPGLTLEDGTLVVTDNYLKVRVPPGRARNERVAVRIDRSDGVLEGTIA